MAFLAQRAHLPQEQLGAARPRGNVNGQRGLPLGGAQPWTYTQRTRFFEIWIAALRNHQLDLTIDIQWCSTTDMVADIMTKPVDKTTSLKHQAWLDPKVA